MNKLPVNNKGKSNLPHNEEHILRTEIIVNAKLELPFLAIVFCRRKIKM
jgi:hypothetical protein